jgi:hypothetical protein
MKNNLGATPDDWAHFDFVLGLGGNLLPCVPASPDVKVQDGSALAGKVGKIPSMFNARGEAHGLTEWQKRPIAPSEVAYWSKDPRLNLCVRTGPISGIYAFDIDIDDERADSVNEDIDRTFGVCLPTRNREKSYKRLLMFRMEEPCKKRKIKLDDKPKGPAIELLADGQQFVACGTHSSGVRYRWAPELPSSIPTITLDQLDSIWATLTSRYAKPSPANSFLTVAERGTTAPTESQVMTAISEEDWQLLLTSLRFLLDKVQDNDTWSEVGYALLSIQHTTVAAQLWLDFSRKAVGYEPGAAEAWWQSHRDQQPRTDFRHIFNMARQRGMQRVASVGDFPPVVDDTPPHSDLVETAPPAVQPTGERRIIRVTEGNFSGVVVELEEVLRPFVYTQGAHLVRTTEAHTVGEIGRAHV